MYVAYGPAAAGVSPEVGSRLAERGMGAGARDVWFVGALHVRAPCEVLGGQLPGEGLGGGRVDAAAAQHLLVGTDRRRV